MSKSSFLFTLIFSFLFTTSTYAADFAFYKKTTNYNIETSIGIATGDTRAAFAVKIVNNENTSLTNTLKVYKTVGTTTTCSSDIVFSETHTAQPKATFKKNIPISTLTPNTTYCFDYGEWVGEHFTTDKGTELPGATSPAVSDGSYHLLAPFPGLSVLIDQSQCGSAKPGEICSIGDLLNFIFKILIGVTAVILVFRLVYEGYTYMVTDVPFLKASSKGNFMTALGGLLLAMAAWLILNTINPKLVSNDISVEEVSVGVFEPEVIDYTPEQIKNIFTDYNKTNSAAFPTTVPDSDPGILHTPTGIVNKVAPIIEGKSGGLQSVKAIIMHGTAGRGGNDGALATWITNNSSSTLADNSAHFVIDRDGTIWQTVRVTKYANHFQPNKTGNSLGISNRNTIGIELTQNFTCNGGNYPKCKIVIWDTITDKQVVAGRALVQTLLTTYGLRNDNIYGHGEVGLDRTPDEGLEFIKRAGFR